MKTNRQNLIKILQAVRPGLASKEILEQTTSFIFTDGKVLTYNDEVAVSHPLPDDVTLEGAVHAKELFALLNKMSDEEVEIEETKNELIVSGQRTKAGIRLEVASAMGDVLDALGQPSSWTTLPEKFLEGVEFCLFSTGKDMTKPMLICVCIEGENVVSSDSQRITCFNMGEDLGMPKDQMMLIPNTGASSLLSYPVTEYEFTKGWIHFRTKDGVVFSCRDVQGDYPLKKALSIVESAEGDAVKLPASLSEALERADIFSDSSNKTSSDRVHIFLSEGWIVVRGESEAGWLEEKSRIRYKGPEIDFEVSSQFLRSILSHSGEMQTCQGSLKFEGENFSHVMAILEGRPQRKARQDPPREEQPPHNPDDDIPF